MKSIILCEGKTDLILLSYYLSKVIGFKSIDKKEYKEYKSRLKHKLNKFSKINNNQDYSWYFRDEDNILCIYATGSNNNLINGLEQVIDINMNTSTETFDKIVIISDRDDEKVEKNITDEIFKVFDKNNIKINTLLHNMWNESNKYKTFGLEEESTIKVLPLIIPFEETGTLETFLLNCRKTSNEADKIVIEKGDLFIEELNSNELVRTKYLNSRGNIPKVKLELYFSVVSPNSTFVEGDKILTSIPWEKYQYIRECFKELDKI